MKILALLSSLWPNGSGGELASHLYFSMLTNIGFDVFVVVPTSNANYDVSKYSFKVIYIPKLGYGKHSLYAPGPLISKLVKSVDVVYFASCCWDLIPFVKAKNKPVVIHLHSYDPVCPVGSLYNFVYGTTCSFEKRSCIRCVYLYERGHFRPFWRAISSTALNGIADKRFAKYLRYADALIFVSNAHRKLFLRHLRHILGGSLPRHYVIYNPLPEISYSPPREFNVGYFGGLSPLKGFHALLMSWVKVYHNYRDVKLYATKMGSLAGSDFLRGINVYAYDKLNLEDLEKLYSNISIVVFPSVWQEPLPYVVVEAMLRGRILVGSNVGGVPEIVGVAPGAMLVPPGDFERLADGLEWALSLDREEAVELGLRNREHLLRRFDSKRSVRELVKVFESVF